MSVTGVILIVVLAVHEYLVQWSLKIAQVGFITIEVSLRLMWGDSVVSFKFTEYYLQSQIHSHCFKYVIPSKKIT